MITLKNLVVDYNNNHYQPDIIINKICLEVQSGEFVTIVGPSGCGKTTILSSLSGLIPIKEGEILLNNNEPNIERRSHRLSTVFQKPIFFEWKTIINNIILPAQIASIKNSEKSANQLLERFHIGEYSNNYPHELSGGMLARVALARALVTEPNFLFLDEAFNQLDEALRDEINLYIQEYWIESALTVVAVTHNVPEAIFMSNKVIILTHKPSKIFKIIDIPFSRPRDLVLRKDKTFVELVEEIRTTLRSMPESV